jgi:hypothetical protein
MKTALTKAVLRYQHTNRGLDELQRRVLLFLYRYPQLGKGWSRDDRSEFIVDFSPKIPHLASRFSYHGYAFETYLARTVQFQVRSFVNRQQQRTDGTRVAMVNDFYEQQTHWDMTVRESPTLSPMGRSLLQVTDDGQVRHERHRRQLLILAMKGCRELSEGQIRLVAGLCRLDPECLCHQAAELRRRVTRRRKQAAALAERRDRAYSAVLCIEDRITKCAEAGERQELLAMASRARGRLRSYRRRIRAMPTMPTHRDIAEVLDIPKGSVDSGMHYLRNTVRKIEQGTNRCSKQAS